MFKRVFKSRSVGSESQELRDEEDLRPYYDRIDNPKVREAELHGLDRELETMEAFSFTGLPARDFSAWVDGGMEEVKEVRRYRRPHRRLLRWLRLRQ